MLTAWLYCGAFIAFITYLFVTKSLWSNYHLCAKMSCILTACCSQNKSTAHLNRIIPRVAYIHRFSAKNLLLFQALFRFFLCVSGDSSKDPSSAMRNKFLTSSPEIDSGWASGRRRGWSHSQTHTYSLFLRVTFSVISCQSERVEVLLSRT